MLNTSGLGIITGNKPQVEQPEIFKEMMEIIEDCDEYALARGTAGGMDWGMPVFNEAFSGLNTGLHIVGGQPNTGKSTLCLQMAWNIAKSNQQISDKCQFKAYVLYLALDDTSRDILPRIVAYESKIPIDVVQKPLKYRDHPNATHLLTRRAEGIRALKRNIGYFKMLDQAHENGCDCIENIEQIIARHYAKLKEIDEHYKLVVFIDNLHDVGTSEGGYRGDENGKMMYITQQLGSMCNIYDIPIICTAEFRKLNGSRRPTYDDVRESGKISYEAKAIMLCYNEHGIKGEASNIYWEQDGNELKQPVLEVKIAKNKLSSNKKLYFFEFMPDLATCRTPTDEASRRYLQMMRG